MLADAELYEFIGGDAPTVEQLVRRYTAQAVGCSPDGAQWWLNWVVRERASGLLVGYVQATVEEVDGTRTGSLAWVVAPSNQRRGHASAATGAMIDWVRRSGVDAFTASIHPDHHASAAVAQKTGFASSGVRDDDGEDVWQLCPDPKEVLQDS